MLRIFWLGLWLIVELFAIYGLQYNRTYKSPYKTLNPNYHMKGSREGGIKSVEPHEDGDDDIELYEQGEVEPVARGGSAYLAQSTETRPSHRSTPYAVVGLTQVEGGKHRHHNHGQVSYVATAEAGSSPEEGEEESSKTTTVLVKHWYKIYYAKIKYDGTWMLNSKWLPWIWWIMYGVMFAAMFYFWYINNDLPDFPQAEAYTNYDITLTLLVIARYLNSGWHYMFWGSGGSIWWLRLAFLDIFGALGVGIAVLVYFYGYSNWISFGLYIPYVLWCLFVTFYTGVFLSTAYKIRSAYPCRK